MKIGCQLALILWMSSWGLTGCYRTVSTVDPAAQPERSGRALIESTKAGDLNAVTTLLDEGVPPNAVVNTNTALTFAARDGQLAIAQTLIARGADINWIDGEGVTPLILASFKGHVDVAKLLLAHGADPTVRDQWQRTALDYALRRGETDEIAQLLQEASPTDD